MCEKNYVAYNISETVFYQEITSRGIGFSRKKLDVDTNFYAPATG